MKLNEFAPPTTGPLKDINYVLQNAPVSPELLTKISGFLKQLSPEKQQTTQTTQTTQPVAPQQSRVAPKLAPTTASKPVAQEPVAQEPIDPETDNLYEAKQGSYASEIIKAVEAGLPEELQAKILYAIKLDAYRNLTDEIITKKIKDKVETIRPLIHEKIDGMGKVISVTAMIDFLNVCKKSGTIDAPKMVSTPTQGATLPIPVLKPEFNKIFTVLCDINPGSAAALGKGEVALAFTGVNTIKSTSDIQVAGKDIEVKSTLKGSDFFLKGAKGYGKKVSDALGKLVSAVNSVGAKLKNVNAAKEGGISQLNNLWVNNLNPYFSKLGQKKVQKLFIDILQDVYSEMSMSGYSKDIISSVNSDGTVDYGLLRLATSKIAFDYYKKTAGHDGILMMNVDKLTYSFQTKSNGFSELVRTGLLSQTSAIDFRNSALGAPTFKLDVGTVKEPPLVIPDVPQPMAGKRGPSQAAVTQLFTNYAAAWARKNGIAVDKDGVNHIAQIVIGGKRRGLTNKNIESQLKKLIPASSTPQSAPVRETREVSPVRQRRT